MGSGDVGSRMTHADQRLPSRPNLYLEDAEMFKSWFRNFFFLFYCCCQYQIFFKSLLNSSSVFPPKRFDLSSLRQFS